MSPCLKEDGLQMGKRNLYLPEAKQFQRTCENLWRSQWLRNSELRKGPSGTDLSEEGSRGDQTAAGPTVPVGSHG